MPCYVETWGNCGFPVLHSAAGSLLTLSRKAQKAQKATAVLPDKVSLLWTTQVLAPGYFHSLCSLPGRLFPKTVTGFAPLFHLNTCSDATLSENSCVWPNSLYKVASTLPLGCSTLSTYPALYVSLALIPFDVSLWVYCPFLTSMHTRARISFWALLFLFKLPSLLPSTQKPSMAVSWKRVEVLLILLGKGSYLPAPYHYHLYTEDRMYSMQCNNTWPCQLGMRCRVFQVEE